MQIVFKRNWIFLMIKYTLILMISIKIGCNIYYVAYVTQIQDGAPKHKFNESCIEDIESFVQQTSALIRPILNVLLYSWITFHLFLYVVGFVGIKTDTFNLTMSFVTVNAMLAVIKVIHFCFFADYFSDILDYFYPIIEAMSAIMSIFYVFYVTKLEDNAVNTPVTRNNRRVNSMI